eukprot:4486828-Amphidinium_carterae.1
MNITISQWIVTHQLFTAACPAQRSPLRCRALRIRKITGIDSSEVVEQARQFGLVTYWTRSFRARVVCHQPQVPGTQTLLIPP